MVQVKREVPDETIRMYHWAEGKAWCDFAVRNERRDHCIRRERQARHRGEFEESLWVGMFIVHLGAQK